MDIHQRRRLLRKRQTESEEILWGRLRNSHLGVKFRRQHSIGPFTSPHGRRTAYLETAGLRVVRVTNAEVLSNLTSVLEMILHHLRPQE